MVWMLRFVQEFRADCPEKFLSLEQKFMALERDVPGFPRGRRWLPMLGREPKNTLIWESEFSSLEEAAAALLFLENNNSHEALLDEQIKYFVRSYAEIYRSLEVDS